MKNLLTESEKYVYAVDAQAHKVFEARVKYSLNFEEIAEIEDISIEQTKALFSKAKAILADTDTAWMQNLSPRARHALKKTTYRSFEPFYEDVNSAKVDLESLPNVGHKVAEEYRRFCAKHKPTRRKEDK